MLNKTQGFVTPTCASMTMWQQITTSNWHDIMNSVAQASGFWAYAYFCIFYIVINLVLLDLTIAMTIEMYNAIKSQYFTSKSSEEEGDSEGVVFQVRCSKVISSISNNHSAADISDMRKCLILRVL